MASLSIQSRKQGGKQKTTNLVRVIMRLGRRGNWRDAFLVWFQPRRAPHHIWG